MKLIRKEKLKEYCGNTLVGYETINVVDALPKEREYIEIENTKGYVVSINYEEEDNYYTIYLEEHLDDWNNQIIDACDCVNVRVG